MSDLQSLDAGEIYHPTAYAAATKRYIIQNARKTYIKNTPDWDAICAFLYDEPNGIVYDNGVIISENFLSKMVIALETYGKLSEGQTNAIRKIMAAKAERKAEWASKAAALDAKRQHIGVVGEKMQLEITCKKIIKIEGASFSYYDSGITYIHICEDADQNVLIYKGKSNNFPREGETALVKFTVKEHGVRNATKQTVMLRPSKVKVAA